MAKVTLYLPDDLWECAREQKRTTWSQIFETALRDHLGDEVNREREIDERLAAIKEAAAQEDWSATEERSKALHQWLRSGNKAHRERGKE